MSGVIYRIINLVNGKFYVGSTVDQQSRFALHRKRLKRGTHHAPHLQAAWTKYGATAFVFEVAEHVEDVAQLAAAEQRWLDEHAGKAYCYNVALDATAPWRGITGPANPAFGRALSEDAKAAIGATLREGYATGEYPHPRTGRMHTDETKARISESKKANPTRYWAGKERSQETKDKIAAAQRGVAKAPRVLTPAGHAKILASAAAGNYSHGTPHTAESKAKLSRPIIATNPAGLEFTYPSISKLRAVLDLKPPTVNRALKSGKPLAAGPRAGWAFRYAA